MPGGRPTLRELLPLLGMVGAVAALLAGLAELRFLELHTGTWDLGIYQQAIWSTAHGRPFYESADLATGGYGSFLQVHSALALYAIVPIYAAAPSPLTLFVVQSLAVTLAAVPLYLIARRLGVAHVRALGLAALYLLSLGTVTSALYDFHIEAFVPLAFFGVAYLWPTRQWRWAIPSVVLAFGVMEVVPVLTFALAAFLLAERALAYSLVRSEAGALRSALERIGRLARDRAAWPDGALLAASALAYYALLALRVSWLHDWFGFPSFPSYDSGYVVGGTPGALGLSLGFLQVGLFGKAEYWALLLLLTGLLPLWYPRALLLVLPWFAFTLFSSDLNYTTIGFQYGFLSGAPLFWASAWGLSRIPPAIVSPRTDPASARPGTARRHWRFPRSRVSVLGLVLIAANVLLSPIDPLMVGGGPGAAYELSYAAPPSLGPLQELLRLLPPGAALVASDNLFPFVANNVNAHTLFYGVNPNLVLPYNLSNLPPYALISTARVFAVPLWLSDTMYVPGDFGIRGVAWSSPAGPAILLEHGYSGPTAYFGATPGAPGAFWPAGLTLSGGAQLVANATAPSGYQAASVSGATGQLWSTPGVSLPPGNYSVTFWIHARVTQGPANRPAFAASASAFALPPLFYLTSDASALTAPGFHALTVTFVTTVPVFALTIFGYAEQPAIQIEVSEVSLGTG